MNKRESERQRVREKLSEQDRKFLDALRALFPNAKLKQLVFNDEEKG